MNVRASSTESGWCFTWQTPAGHWLELEFIPERNRWLQRFKPYDPDVPDPPWTPAQKVELPAAVDQDDAEAIATRYAEGSP